MIGSWPLVLRPGAGQRFGRHDSRKVDRPVDVREGLGRRTVRTHSGREQLLVDVQDHQSGTPRVEASQRGRRLFGGAAMDEALVSELATEGGPGVVTLVQ